MRERNDPWKWPFVLTLTAGLWPAAIFWLPTGVIDFVFAPHRQLTDRHQRPPARWITLVPPPQIRVVETEPTDRKASEPPPVEVATDPDWWTSGMRIRIVDATVLTAGPPRATLRDTVELILHELGIVRELEMIDRPDSVVAAALVLLAREDALKFADLEPYFSAVARSRDYADIMSRAADMYGDFLQQEIRVPD